MRFADSPAVVTGAASGIGQSVGVRLAAEGARVALVDLDTDGLDRTRELVVASGGHAVAVPVDVSDAGAVARAVDRAAASLGPPRILVNGAGIVIRKALLDTTPEEWDRVIRVNLNGYFHVLRAVVPHMSAAGGGSIVQIASISAHRGGHGYPSYAASKGGILALTRMLADELASANIRVNSVSPGAVRTPSNSSTFAVSANRTAMEGAISLGRLGEPDDIAGVIAFLGSSEAGYITGVDLPVDGGLLSRIPMPAVVRAVMREQADHVGG